MKELENGNIEFKDSLELLHEVAPEIHVLYNRDDTFHDIRKDSHTYMPSNVSSCIRKDK